MVRADKRRYHYIYKTTCLITQKYYIGMHSTDDLDDGYLGSGTILSHSVKKYGKEAHRCEILEFLPDRSALKLREKAIVTEDVVSDTTCMNLKKGGDGGWDNVNATVTSEARKENGKAGAVAKNKMILAEKQANSEFWMKRKQQLVEHITTTTQRRIDADPEKWEHHVRENIKRMNSPESKEKRMKTYEEIQHQRGESNSQFGTKWITDGFRVIKCKSDDLQRYLDSGWKIGRK